MWYVAPGYDVTVNTDHVSIIEILPKDYNGNKEEMVRMTTVDGQRLSFNRFHENGTDLYVELIAFVSGNMSSAQMEEIREALSG